jgi:hypothetical protein
MNKSNRFESYDDNLRSKGALSPFKNSIANKTKSFNKSSLLANGGPYIDNVTD